MKMYLRAIITKPTFMKIFMFLFIFLFPGILTAQKAKQDSICISPDELHLTERINKLRKQNKLPAIPLSRSLTFVAKTHIHDLQLNRPDTSICSSVSWSDKGKWTPCCYNKYVVNMECMWDKPKELSPYKYRGYEISYFEEGLIHADSVFDLWMSSQEVKDMLLGKGIHSDKKWQAMGIAIGDHYVSLWLGQRPDPLGKPGLCSTDNQVSTQKSDGSNDSKTAKYYLIYGSYRLLIEAEEEVKKHQLAGFKNAQVLTNGEKIRVALSFYDSIKEAIAAKEKIKDKYKEVWILKN